MCEGVCSVCMCVECVVCEGVVCRVCSENGGIRIHDIVYVCK